MTLANIDWPAVSLKDGAELKQEVFSILQRACNEIQNTELDDPSLLSVVPRLAGLIERRAELKTFDQAFSAFARSVGLWNYINKTVADARDELAAEVATLPELGIVLHRERAAALNLLLGGKNLILSAPTSFGKSILIDALLLHERYKRIAIVVPTIALLDELRRRIALRFRDQFDVLTHHSETSERDRVIFLGTQERLISRQDLGNLDLVVVDEFYKLDPARKDERHVALNTAVYKLLRKAKQFFFLGPNITKVVTSEDNRWQFSFLGTRFSTVAVDTYDLHGVPDKAGRLHEEIGRESNWPAIVFASSPDRANAIAAEVVNRNQQLGDGKELAQWIVANYGPRWTLSQAVAIGVAIHHGRIPRSLASRFVQLFNRGSLPVLICTSTLIEGVNTAAKSVLIYDKKIAKTNFDFFTFSNIRGRAGRLGQHYVGNVFLFNSPPEQVSYDVSTPLFGALDEASDDFIVHVDTMDETPAISSRILEVAARVGLSPDEVKRFSTIGLDTLERLREETNRAIAARAEINWRDYPQYDQIEAVAEIVCKVKTAQDFGCASASQLTMYLNKLRQDGPFKDFFLWHSQTFRGADSNLENVFKFLRAAEYSLPEYFGAVGVYASKAGLSVDYSLFLAELPRWFRSDVLKILDEQGIPIQISERFISATDTVPVLRAKLRQFALARDRRLSAMECDWILDAIPG